MSPAERQERQRRLEHTGLGLLVAFLAVALAVSFWGVLGAPALAERADNPRRVEEELRIRRGRILDSSGVVLAETVGPPEAPRRLYPVPEIGPAVGYYSFRHGTSGVEESYNTVLRGDGIGFWAQFWQEHLHQEQVGRDIRVTLAADWQRTADALLGQREGAVVLLSLPDGAIRALVSHPAYNPNRLDEQFEALLAAENAPLLNRATQGSYQPGLVLQPFILAAALDQELLSLASPAPAPDRPVVVRGNVRRCATEPPDVATWADVLQHACPGPMLALDGAFDAAALEATLADFGFTRPPVVPLDTAAAVEVPVDEVDDSLIGQGTLTVTPLQVSLALAALANEGLLPDPQLVTAVERESGLWQTLAHEAGDEPRVVSEAAAAAILDALPVEDGLFREYATLALAGPAGTTNA
ncbi:MAG: penicillin-binding transpeptidase domain-containing protein, partial [Candidatus Promineifilaceae bacterium]|nr:penicillin-binding transpeptidase domain-containing protein [Candidatus Promineifilaceae bacterium]